MKHRPRASVVSAEFRAPAVPSAEERTRAIRLEYAVRKLRDRQNRALGLVAGGGAALLATTLWALVTAVAPVRIAWMALGVGLLVGLAVRVLGRGVDAAFGFMGAAWTLLGCAGGSFLEACAVLSVRDDVPLLDLLWRIDIATAGDLMLATFAPVDLFLYALAPCAAFRLSIRHPSERELTHWAG